MLKSTAALVIVLLCSFSAFPQQAPRNSAGQSAAEHNSPGLLQQIIPGHYVYTSTNFNSGVIVTTCPLRAPRFCTVMTIMPLAVVTTLAT